mmetsp:Transcript_2579/g.9119  ORF Transcript_2579/g.9119 Transcript_2579/m.9119 type:complete len:352 (-) Transcript_2579:313-1368(-)
MSSSCRRLPLPPRSTPLRPTMSTCPSPRSCALCVSPSTCFSSFSSVSLSRYASASRKGSMLSANMMLNLSRFCPSPLNTRSTMRLWCGLSRLSEILFESCCRSHSTRLRLSSEILSTGCCMMPSTFTPYTMLPSSLTCAPKCSTCTIPSSSSKNTSDSKLTYLLRSKSRMLTEVRSSPRPCSCASLLQSSTTAVNSPPCTRSELPSLSFKAKIWFAPKGMNSPISTWQCPTCMASSSSSLMFIAASFSSLSLPALSVIAIDPSLRSDSGMYGELTYDTSSMSVIVLSLVMLLVRPLRVNSPFSACHCGTRRSGLPLGVYTNFSTASLSSSVSIWAMSACPLAVGLYASELR